MKQLLFLLFIAAAYGQSSDSIDDLKKVYGKDIQEIWQLNTSGQTITTQAPVSGAPDYQGNTLGCICVPYYNCDPVTNKTITSGKDSAGFGIINIRFGQGQGGTELKCAHYLDICCFESDPPEPTNVDNGPVIGESTDKPTRPPTRPPTEKPPPEEPIYCGIRNTKGVGFQITGNDNNESEYAEFPWMVALIKKNYVQTGNDNLSVCGGSIIHQYVVLTGAHCVDKLRAEEIRIRAGEWDTQTGKEQFPYQERDIAQIIKHESYNPNTVINDVALLILKNPIDWAPNIRPVCLPSQGHVFNQKECFVTGWGKKSFGKLGQLSVILKKIDVPMVLKDKCENDLRKTRLGKKFNLHPSFVCAGGEAGKDACTGDGGGPLVCPDHPGSTRFEQAGTVAWGIGCGDANVPGVYGNVALFRNWIDSHMRRLGYGTSTYTI